MLKHYAPFVICTMKTIGLILGIISILGSLVGFFPFLGWFNWVGIPFAIFSLIFCVIFKANDGKTLSTIAIIIGIIRLLLGGGVF